MSSPEELSAMMSLALVISGIPEGAVAAGRSFSCACAACEVGEFRVSRNYLSGRVSVRCTNPDCEVPTVKFDFARGRAWPPHDKVVH